MAGTKSGGAFAELISPFLHKKIEEAAETFGPESHQVRALTLQYFKSPQENVIRSQERRRHYESEVQITFNGRTLIGVERLYRRTILIEPTTACAAHCRWCLRGQYPVKTMSKEDITAAARYIGSPELRDDVSEVLITGGDPLMSLPLLALTISELARNAPNVTTVRIGSRVPFHDPRRINADMMAVFARYPEFRFEIGLNVNHPVEFWPESIEALERLKGGRIRLYNQHPLLKGVNDNVSILVELYSLLRNHDIDAHYLFHAIPLQGMSHHRTSLKRGLELAAALGSCGEFSGRGKPHFAVMTDIGKIVLFHGSVLQHRARDNAVLLQSHYRYEDRVRWVPGWQKPLSVEIDKDGFMHTWYLDGDDERDEESADNLRALNARR